MRQECVSKGNPAQLVSLVQSAFVTLQADGRQVPILRVVDRHDLEYAPDGYTVVGYRGGPERDALTARLQVDNRTGEPMERYAMLLFEQEPGDVSRLHLHIEPAGWDLFGRMFWEDLRGELARRGLLVEEAAVIGGETTTAATEPAVADGSITPEKVAMLRKLWANDDMTVAEIARKINYGEDNLRKRVAKQLGLPPRKRGRKPGR